MNWTYRNDQFNKFLQISNLIIAPLLTRLAYILHFYFPFSIFHLYFFPLPLRFSPLYQYLDPPEYCTKIKLVQILFRWDKEKTTYVSVP